MSYPNWYLFLCRRYANFLDALPALGMLLFLVFSSWVNLYKFCWVQLIKPTRGLGLDLGPSEQPLLGTTLLVIMVFLRFTWVGAWVQMLVITWFCDKRWRSPTDPKNIMQIEPGDISRALDSDRGFWFPYEEGKFRPCVRGIFFGQLTHLDRRPRDCTRSNACRFGNSLGIADRVYHCSRFDRCLPLYDHYCPFLKCTVYLRTIKPYLFVLVFLPLDSLFSIALSCYALSYARVLVVHLSLSIFLSAAAMIFVCVRWTQGKIRLLAFRNVVYPERKLVSNP